MNSDVIYPCLLFFLLGVFCCYFSLQYSFFDIKYELDPLNMLLSIGTIIVGIYIADTLQKRVNRGQNQYSFLIDKIDQLWKDFNGFSNILHDATHVTSAQISSHDKTFTLSTTYIKSLFSTFNLSLTEIAQLELQFITLEEFLSNLPAENNQVEIRDNRLEIDTKVKRINTILSKVLIQIQKL